MPFSCKECGAECEQGSNLKTHMATHPGEIDLLFARSVGQYFPKAVIGRDICEHILERGHLDVAVVLLNLFNDTKLLCTAEDPPIGKIHPFSKMAATFEPLM